MAGYGGSSAAIGFEASGPPNPPYESVNLSIFSIPDLSQIKDLAGMKIAKTGNIHILYEAVNRSDAT
jgi:hypothetical protein